MNPLQTSVHGDPYTVADYAASAIAAKTGQETHDLAIVLGSGWAAAAAQLGAKNATVTLDSLPGFPAPTVAGHANALHSIVLGDKAVLVFGARAHLYEGHDPATVVHAVRTAAAAGCRGVVLTNAAGSVRPEWAPGQLVAIADHLNLTGSSPMVGDPPGPGRPDRFIDLTDLYSPRLRAVAVELADVPEGTYAGLLGGNYETPAEIRMLRAMGADLVGMSTVLEAIAARHLGLEVFGLSLVTNPAAGVGAEALAHAEVLATAEDSRQRVVELLGEIVARW